MGQLVVPPVVVAHHRDRPEPRPLPPPRLSRAERARLTSATRRDPAEALLERLRATRGQS